MSVQLVSGNELLSFEQIMGADDLAPINVPVPEWKGSVSVRPLTAYEQAAAQETATVGGKMDTVKYAQLLIAASLVQPAVTDEQAADLVARRSAKAITRIVRAITEINADSEEVQQALAAEFPATD